MAKRLRRPRTADIPRALVVALLLATGLVVVLGKYPHHELAGARATTAAKIVGAPAFVVAIRMVVMYAVVFILASVLARIWNGHWLRRAGPFEVADNVQALKEERDRLRDEAEAADARAGRLTDELRSSNAVIEVAGSVRALGEERDRLRDAAAAADVRLEKFREDLRSADASIRQLGEAVAGRRRLALKSPWGNCGRVGSERDFKTL